MWPFVSLAKHLHMHNQMCEVLLKQKKTACMLQVKHILILLGSESVVLNQKDEEARKAQPSTCFSAAWIGVLHVDDAL